MPATSATAILTIAMKLLEIALRAMAQNRELTPEEIAAEFERLEAGVNLDWKNILKEAGL